MFHIIFLILKTTQSGLATVQVAMLLNREASDWEMPSKWQVHSCGHCCSQVSKYIILLFTCIKLCHKLNSDWILALKMLLNYSDKYHTVTLLNELPLNFQTFTVHYNLNSLFYFLISSKSSFSCWPKVSPPALSV